MSPALEHLLIVLRLVSVSDRLEPISKVNPFETRFVIASAIVNVTSDPQEQALLLSVARWESFFREDVLRCSRRGGGVALGPWQVVPRTAQERKTLCSDLFGSVLLVRERIKESNRLCKSLPENERLSAYTSGSCESSAGRMLSRMRMKTAKEVLKMNTSQD